MARALRWFLRCRSPRDQPLIHDVFDGQRVFPCYTDSIIAKHVMYRSEWFDWDLMHFMEEFMKPDDRYLDVGTNVGLHVLNASRLVATNRIFCVEPHPRNLERLRLCLRLNGLEAATVLPVAASSQSGKVRLVGDDVFSRTQGTGALTEGSFVGMEVDAVRLDEVLPMEMIHLAKLDVEGGEWQVLMGLEEHISKGLLPALVLELLGHARTHGLEEAEFVRWLQQQGYRLGMYRHDQSRFDWTAPMQGDVWAISPAGIDLIRQRMPLVAM